MPDTRSHQNEFDELAMQGTWLKRLEKLLATKQEERGSQAMPHFLRDVANMLTLRDKRVHQLQGLARGARVALLNKERL